MKPFKNLVFDIGNVIIDIDYSLPQAEFQKLATVDFTGKISYSHQVKVFDLFEMGAISSAQFRTELRKFLKPDVTDAEIDYAWNCMITAYPKHKFTLLKNLMPNYQTYFLSNINEIHIDLIDSEVQKQFGATSMAEYVHVAYYSNLIKLRKPAIEIYNYLLQKEQINPAETFFVDDKLENIEAAKQAGIQAYHLADRDKLEDLLMELNIL